MNTVREGNMKKVFCCIAIVSSLTSVDVYAENTYKESMIRCEKGIVSLGDAKIMLITKCGNPVYQEYTRYQTEQMTYVTDGFYRVVTIKGGDIKSIITAGRAN